VSFICVFSHITIGFNRDKLTIFKLRIWIKLSNSMDSSTFQRELFTQGREITFIYIEKVLLFLVSLKDKS
jgi:hypothetical protein